MRKLILVLFITVWSIGSFAKELVYFVDFSSFYDKSDKPYIEVAFSAEAPTAFFARNKEGKYQGAIQIHYIVSQKEGQNTSTAYERNFILESSPVADTNTTNLAFAFMDLKRISLSPGDYIFTGTIVDENDPGATEHKFIREFTLKKQPETFCTLSDVKFIESMQPTQTDLPYSKYGYNIIPLVTNGTFINQDSLKFYLEAYHIDRESEQLAFLTTYIKSANSKDKLAGYKRTYKLTAKPFNLISGGFDIRKLPSQTYYLEVELYSRKNKLINSASEKFFVVNSNVTPELTEGEEAFDRYFNLSEEQLDYYFKPMFYIAGKTEKGFFNALETYEQKKRFFYKFWNDRQGSEEESPVKAWQNFEAKVRYANNHYRAGFKEGWKTDRGRVLIMYGAPNDIQMYPSDDSRYPYEEWRYNQINTQANVLFVFYEPESAIGEYLLLHSDKFEERNNPRWRMDLIKRNVQVNDWDVEDPNTPTFQR